MFHCPGPGETMRPGVDRRRTMGGNPVTTIPESSRSGRRRLVAPVAAAAALLLGGCLLTAALPAALATPAASGEASEAAQPVPALPDTAAGRAFSDWLAVYNAGDEERARRFIGERFDADFLAQLPLDMMLAFHLQTHERTGALTPRRLLPAGDDELALVADAERGEAMEVRLSVAAEPPHRITALRLVPAEPEGGGDQAPSSGGGEASGDEGLGNGGPEAQPGS